MGPIYSLEVHRCSLQAKAKTALSGFVLLVSCYLGNCETIGECDWNMEVLTSCNFKISISDMLFNIVFEKPPWGKSVKFVCVYVCMYVTLEI